MAYLAFEENNLKTVSDALDIAEDKTGNYYKLSFNQWKRYRYDVKTQNALAEDEITSYAFALLNKCSNPLNRVEPTIKKQDFYIICLQDHQILEALKRDNHLELLPLLTYIFTHELVHIVRFCNFYQRYEVTGEEKDSEERRVHATTFDVLKDISIPKLDYIFRSYQHHRVYEHSIS